MAEEGAGELHLHYLNHPDVQALALSDAEIVAAVEQGLVAQGRGETTIEPRMPSSRSSRCSKRRSSSVR